MLARVLSVKTERIGSVLSADAAATDTILYVQDITPFDTSGTLEIGAETIDYTRYISEDEQIARLDLAVALTGNYTADEEPVYTSPEQTHKTALVTDGKVEERLEMTSCMWLQLADGERELDAGEWVRVENNIIISLSAQAPVPNPEVLSSAATMDALFGANRVSGRYYSTPVTWGYKGTIFVHANLIYAIPFLVAGDAQAFDQILVRVSTAYGGGLMRLGIYSDTSGAPGSLVLDAGEVDTSTTGLKTLAISQSLSPGLHWLVLANKIGTGNQQAVWAVGDPINFLGWSSLADSSLAGNTIYNAFTYAALPSTFPLSSPSYVTEDYPPGIFLRKT